MEIISLGWYEAAHYQSINGYFIKGGMQIYVPELTVHEDKNLCYVTIRLNDWNEIKMKAETFLERFKKVE